MANKCPKCHSDNPSDSQFCAKCGTQLISSEELPASPTKTLETPKEEMTTSITFAWRTVFSFQSIIDDMPIQGNLTLY